MPVDIRERAVSRLQQDTDLGINAIPEHDLELLDYIDFADIAKILRKLLPTIDSSFHEKVQIAAKQLESLSPIRNRVCHSRPLEENDFATLLDFIDTILPASHFAAFPEVANCVKKLRDDPTFVLHLTIPEFWTAGLQTILHNLPDPEFDETGFVGRTKERNDIERLLLKTPYPIITIVGEGGVGKTALAVKCLYELIDGAPTAYDAVVWVSLKQKVLTSTGANEIRTAVSSTLGVLQEVAESLGAPMTANMSIGTLINEIHAYMKDFKVLLAIDNFESAAMDQFRPLFSDVPMGSKIVLTSRIGLNEFELRYALMPLEANVATMLLRRHARSLNVTALYKASEINVAKYCHRLFSNPLLIKWFVSAVSLGADPDQLLKKTNRNFQQALSFCFEQLYDRLNDKETRVVKILSCARKPLTLVELRYLIGNDMTPDDLDWTLHRLHNSSILRRTSDSANTEANGILYSLSEIAQLFIKEFANPGSELYQRVQKALKHLSEIAQAERTNQAFYKYDIYSPRAATRDELIAAVHLRRALSLLKRQSGITQVREAIDTAKQLCPGYAEVYRIAGIVESSVSDTYVAHQNYEKALELNPNSSIAYFTFSLFLTRHVEDFDHALEMINQALQLDPLEPTLLTHKALVLTRLARYSEAASIYETIVASQSGRPRPWRISTRDQYAECFRRWANEAAQQKDYEAFKARIRTALTILEEARRNSEIDEKTSIRLSKVVDDIAYPVNACDTTFVEEVISRITSSFTTLRLNIDIRTVKFIDNELSHKPELKLAFLQQVRPEGHTSENTTNTTTHQVGEICSIVKGTCYGFIELPDGRRLFFHRRSLVNPRDWPNLRERDKVIFRFGENERGTCAVNVKRSSS